MKLNSMGTRMRLVLCSGVTGQHYRALPVAVALMRIRDRVAQHVHQGIWGTVYTVLREGGRP